MITNPIEVIPHTETGRIKAQFEQYGHVGISGLVDPAVLEPAIQEAQSLTVSLKSNQRFRETIAKLPVPDPDEERGLHAVLEGIQEGAAILGRDIAPESIGKTLIELSEMERETEGSVRRYRGSLVGVVATINLRGREYRWIESSEDDESSYYVIDPADVVIQDIGKKLRHRSSTGRDSREPRIGLAIAKNAPPMVAQIEAFLANQLA